MPAKPKEVKFFLIQDDGSEVEFDPRSITSVEITHERDEYPWLSTYPGYLDRVGERRFRELHQGDWSNHESPELKKAASLGGIPLMRAMIRDPFFISMSPPRNLKSYIAAEVERDYFLQKFISEHQGLDVTKIIWKEWSRFTRAQQPRVSLADCYRALYYVLQEQPDPLGRIKKALGDRIQELMHFGSSQLQISELLEVYSLYEQRIHEMTEKVIEENKEDSELPQISYNQDVTIARFPDGEVIRARRLPDDPAPFSHEIGVERCLAIRFCGGKRELEKLVDSGYDQNSKKTLKRMADEERFSRKFSQMLERGAPKHEMENFFQSWSKNGYRDIVEQARVKHDVLESQREDL